MQNLFANCKRLPAVVTSNRNWPFAYEFIGDAGAFAYYRINQTGSFESKSRWRHWPIVFRSEQNGLMTFHRFFQCCSRSKWPVTIAIEKFPSNRLNVCCSFSAVCRSSNDWQKFCLMFFSCLFDFRQTHTHTHADGHAYRHWALPSISNTNRRCVQHIWFGLGFFFRHSSKRTFWKSSLDVTETSNCWLNTPSSIGLSIVSLARCVNYWNETVIN